MASLLSRVVLGAGVAAALIAPAPGIAGAQPAPRPPAPSAADQQAAGKLVDEGIAAQDAKDYDKAIELYRKAYALVPHPILMFNIGQAHRLAGRPDQAATFYERYLELDPEGSQAVAARAALDEIKASRPAEPPPPEPRPPVTPAPAPEPIEAAASPGRSLRITGIVLGGAGLASAAVGVYFTTRVLHWESEAEQEGPPFTVSKPRGETAQLRGDLAYGIAGALAIGGAVTYWLGHRKDQAARTTAVLPVVGGGFAGIALTGSLP